MSLLLLVVLSLVAVTGLRSSIVEEMVSGNQKMSATALLGAEQGVSAALDELFAATISDSGREDDVNWSEAGATSGAGYSANYTVSHLVRGGAQVQDDDGRRYFLINSTGETGSGDARRMIEVGIALEWGANSNVAGLIGCQGVSGWSNVTTGSYSSSGQESDGDRGDIATTDSEAFLYLVGSSDMNIVGEVRATGALYMDSDAQVQRDALANAGITMMSNSVIWGSAYTNGSVELSNSPDYHVKGDIYQGPSVVPDPIVPYTQCDPWDIDSILSDAAVIKSTNHNEELGVCAGCDFFASSGDIGVAGSASDYYFDDFTIDSEGSLTIQGEVRIYLSGNWLMDSNSDLIFAEGASLKVYLEAGTFTMNSNSVANDLGLPIDFHVYSKYEDVIKDDKDWTNGEPDVWDDGESGVKIFSNSVFNGIIYAPRSHVWFDSNARVRGSARGRFVDAMSDLQFTYDEDLDVLWTGNPTDYKLVYWTERYPE